MFKNSRQMTPIAIQMLFLEMGSIIILILDSVNHFIPQFEGIKRYTSTCLSHFLEQIYGTIYQNVFHLM